MFVVVFSCDDDWPSADRSLSYSKRTNVHTRTSQVKSRPAAQESQELTIITGRNAEPAPQRTRSTQVATGEEYVLSNVVQEVLVEDFYPPISSSTVPGNPGRLQVKLCDLFL